MRSLLDVNLLIALLDDDHIFHQSALTWFTANQKDGWASCPLTQNGFVRISANPRYSGFDRFSIYDSISQLGKLIENTDHQFWADDISILDSSLFSSDRIHGPRQLTDLYLLALAVRNDGRLVTFDESIPLSAVPGAGPANLCVV
jgi:toxin-antitoxin system PIN domain toxin